VRMPAGGGVFLLRVAVKKSPAGLLTAGQFIAPLPVSRRSGVWFQARKYY